MRGHAEAPAAIRKGTPEGRGRSRERRGLLATAIVAVFALALAIAPSAGAIGYAQDPTHTFAVGSNPYGIAIDQSTGDVYVSHAKGSGLIDKFGPTGTPGTPTNFGPVETGRFAGVAVSPLDPDADGDHDVLGLISDQPSRQIAVFDTVSGGAPVNSITSNIGTGIAAAQIATDSAGNIYVPIEGASIVKLNPSGTELLQTITCSACPAPASFEHLKGVTVDSAGNIYAAEGAEESHARLIKFGPGGDADPTPPSVVFEGGPTEQTITGIGVDPASNNVFLATVFVSGEEFVSHVLVFNPAGTQIGSFGEGVLGGLSGTQNIAVNATSGIVYVGDPANSRVVGFAPVEAPAVETTAATAVAKTTATLNATVDPEGNEVSACGFEYVTGAQFAIDGFLSATSASCASLPGDGTSPVAVSVNVSSLKANTLYHFRAKATNEGGETIDTTPAEGLTFTTEAEATPPPPPPPPSGGGGGSTPTPTPAPAPAPAPGPAPAPQPKPLKCKKGFKKKTVKGKAKCVKQKKHKSKKKH